MASSNQSSSSIVDAFFRFFSTDKPEEASTTHSNLNREWKQQNAEPVPGVVRSVRNNSVQSSSASLSSSHSSMSTLPETPSRGSLKMTNGSLQHGELTRSSSSAGSMATPNGARRSGAVSDDIPFVIADPRIRKFRTLLGLESVDLDALSKLTWNGVPEEFRGMAWRLLLGYSPPSSNRRDSVLSRKREEYRDLVNRYYIDLSTNGLKPDWIATLSNHESALIHQIRIDVPRTLPHNPLFAHPRIQRALERILLMWALRHPASGYVQGINDLVTPFIVVFLREILNSKTSIASSSASNKSESPEAQSTPETEARPSTFQTALATSQDTSEQTSIGENTLSQSPRSETSYDSDDSKSNGSEKLNQEKSRIRSDSADSAEEARPKKFSRSTEDLQIDLEKITDVELAQVEADSYWAVSKFIDCIQDNYTSSQPGIQRSLHRLSELVGKLDPVLYQHLQTQGVMFVQFAFRWVNCLLMRELPLNLVIRLWDTYIAEGDRFPTLHTYVCASFLIAFSKDLVSSDFQTLMMFLHHLPTDHWTTDTIEPLISQAFMWQTLYGDATQHLRASTPH